MSSGWAHALSRNEAFQYFVKYVRDLQTNVAEQAMLSDVDHDRYHELRGEYAAYQNVLDITVEPEGADNE